MNETLAPCEGCARHVRESAPACPFCGAVRAASTPRELVVAPFGLARAGLLALGATLSLGACGATLIAQPYGAPPNPPPRDAGAQDAAPPSVVAIYGAPAYKPLSDE